MPNVVININLKDEAEGNIQRIYDAFDLVFPGRLKEDPVKPEAQWMKDQYIKFTKSVVKRAELVAANASAVGAILQNPDIDLE